MKQIASLLLFLSSVASYPMDNITPEQRAAFNKKYPMLADVYERERQRANIAIAKLALDNASKQKKKQELNRTVNDRIILKIKNIEDGIKAAASILPVFAIGGKGIVFLGTSVDKTTFAGVSLMLAKYAVHKKRKDDPEFLSATVSGLGMITDLNIDIIFRALAKHLYFYGLDNVRHMTASTVGEYVASSIAKTESNWVTNIPFTDHILLRDSQIFGIGFKTAGHLIAKNKKPTSTEILYELLTNTAGEIAYSTLAQTAPDCLQYALPRDCNPATDDQKTVKYIITEVAGYLIGAIAPLVANSSLANNIAHGTTTVLNACLQPLLPM